MRNDCVNMVIQVKEGRTWKDKSYEVSNHLLVNWTEIEREIYDSLTKDLIAKKLNKCTYIKSIKRIPLYNGFQRITVTYDNDVRRIYTVEN